MPDEQGEDLEAERELCARAHAGDKVALGELLRRHGQRLYRVVLLPRLGSRAAAEEALAVTYVKVVERFHLFSWQGVGVYPWLRIVALRVALDHLRKRKREVLFEPADLEATLGCASDTSDTSEELERQDLALGRQRVEEVLGRINERYALAIRLRVLEGQSRQDAAAKLEVSVATFDVVLHRAVQALRKVLPNAEAEAS